MPKARDSTHHHSTHSFAFVTPTSKLGVSSKPKPTKLSHQLAVEDEKDEKHKSSKTMISLNGGHHHHSSQKEMTWFPQPTPDIQITPPLIASAAFSTYFTLSRASGLSIVLPPSPTISISSVTSSSTLSSMSTQSSTGSSTLSLSSMTSTPVVASQSSEISSHSSPRGLHPSVAALVVFGIGVLFAGAGIFIILRCWCCRPQKRQRLIPSKPMPHTSSFEDEDSPMFGTKERFSVDEKLGEKAVWAWNQYPLAYKENELAPSCANIIEPDVEIDQTRFRSYRPSVPSPHQLSTLPRLSESDIGLAIGGSPHVVANQSSAQHRQSLNRRNTTFSVFSSAYGGAEVLSPSITAEPAHGSRSTPAAPLPAPVPRSASATSGRARIKRPYVSGHFTRPSFASNYPLRDTVAPVPPPPARHARHISHVDDDYDSVIYSLPPPPDKTMVQSSLHSPEPSIHPEDSLSVVAGGSTDEARIESEQAEARRALRALAVRSISDASAAMEERRRVRALASRGSILDSGESLGSLMLADDEVSYDSHDPLTERKISHVGPLKLHKKSASRVDERPPRVPSPPLLPSLAQMALANDPRYDNYRSPTYSLYACYEE